MSTRIRFRRDTAANWTSTNPILTTGELGLETDTGKFKIGNNSDAWTILPYSIRAELGEGNLNDLKDVTITSAANGDFLRWNGSAWINDAVNLGTDTTGSFVASLVAGTGVTVTNNSGEDATPTVAIGQAVATTDSPTFANVTITSAPTDVNHAATKAYVDFHAAGIVWHDAVKLATAAALPGTPTYSNGTSGVGATLTATSNARLLIDGTNATTNDRVLIKDQADAKQNGVYKVTAQGSASVPYVLTRATDFDASPSFEHIGSSGDAVYVTSGAYNSNQGFITLSTGTGTDGTYIIGTDDITFGQFTGTATFVAGNGVTITGNTINVESANSGRIVVGGDSIDLALVTRTNTSGTAGKSFIQSFTTDSYGRVTGAVTADTAITLGTDTSGNYVASLVAGTGITLTNNTGETATPTVEVTANTYDAYGASSTVAGNLTTHANLTEAHGATGAVVGTTNTQTLTNKTLTSPKINENVALTASATELNVLDGITATTAELNILSGVTATAAEINYVDGVTSAVQTQLDAKAPLASPTFTGTVTLPSGTVTSVMIADGTIVNADINASAAIDKTKISGTAITAGDTGTVTSTIIANDTIVNADINSSAAISVSKLAGGTSGQMLITGAAGPIYVTPYGDIAMDSTGQFAIAANSVALGTKTTGDYVASLVAGTGVTLSNNTGESATPTIAIGQAVGTASNVQFANITATGTVTLAADPASALQAATKQYVDNVVSGINFHQSVVAATSGNLAGTYNNGTSGVGATITKASNGSIGTIDGATVVVGNRILLKSQTDPKENGIYTITAVGSGSAPWVVTRATDADNNPTGELAAGDFCFVTGGSTNAGYGYINNSTASPIVIGTSDITYTVFNAAQVVTGGAGLAFTGNTLDIGTASTSRIVVNADNIDLASGVVTTGTYKSVTVDTYGRVTAGTNPTTLSGYGITDAAPIASPTFTGTVTIPTGASITLPTVASGINHSGSSSGTTKLQASAVASGTLTLPATTGTLSTLDGTETLTNKTLTSPTTNTPTLTLSTSTSTTAGRIAYDSTALKLIVGDGTTAREYASSTIITNAQTASYTAVLGDKDKLVEISNASANTFTIPPNSSVAFPIGTQIRVLQTSTGQCTLTAGAGVTVNATPGLKLRTQWASATLIKRATDTWVAVGDLSA